MQVLGAGSGRTFDLSTMRYGRVMIMADADVDGSHIRTLLITLFAKYMRPVVEQGRLFAAMPPLHKVVTKGRNPETRFTFTQREMEQTVARVEAAISRRETGIMAVSALVILGLALRAAFLSSAL